MCEVHTPKRAFKARQGTQGGTHVGEGRGGAARKRKAEKAANESLVRYALPLDSTRRTAVGADRGTHEQMNRATSDSLPRLPMIGRERYDRSIGHFNVQGGMFGGRQTTSSSGVPKCPMPPHGHGSRVGCIGCIPHGGPLILGIYLQSRTCSIQHRTIAACMHC